MRFDRIEATAFGAVRGASLEFPSNMTVVHGPNEAGKSTWFAAIYAGLVGRRVSRGRGTRAQTDFRRRHKPWSGSQWRVRLTITLDSGRRLALDHDLQAGSIRVTDATTDRLVPVAQLERELGVELDAEAGFDGARMLGLTREAVRSTIFVGQADVLAVLRNADELQEHLQRAASSVRVDTTAEQALEWIAEQRRERVGSPHIGNRPLRATAAALEAARASLGDAIDARHSLRELRVALAAQQAELAGRSHDVEELKRAFEWARIDQLGKRLSHALELAAEVETLREAPTPAEREIVARVTSAVEAFRARGEAPTKPEGQDAASLLAELEALPTMPEGPRQPEPAVLEAARRLSDAQAVLATLSETRPQLVEASDAGIAPSEIRAFAQALRETPPVLADGIHEQISVLTRQYAIELADYQNQRDAYEKSAAEYAARQADYDAQLKGFEQNDARYRQAYEAYSAEVRALQAAQQQRLTTHQSATRATAKHQERVRAAGRARALGVAGLVSGGVLLVAAAVMAVLGAIAVTIGVGALGAVLLVAGIVVMARRVPASEPPPPLIQPDLPAVLPEPVRPKPPDPPAAMTVVAPGQPPDRPLALVEAERELDRWEVATQEHTQRRERVLHATADLGLPSDPAKLEEVARAVEDKEAAQQRVDIHGEKVDGAASAVTAAARDLLRQVGGPQDLPDEVVVSGSRAALDDYLRACAERDTKARAAERRADLQLAVDQRLNREREYAKAAEAFARTETELLATAASLELPKTDASVALAHLDTWLTQQQQYAQSAADRKALEGRLGQLLDGSTIEELKAEHTRRVEGAGDRPERTAAPTPESLALAEQRRDDVAAEVARLEGRIGETEGALSSIPEAIEHEALAARDAERVQSLGGYLALAETHLAVAKDRAHADIAPVLANTIRPWVPRVTADRFVDVEIDPATLMVRAVENGGRMRNADVLSQGTMEQLFLLLRIALAEHLSSTDEVAPLVLDDVTVQSDPGRKKAILELLREVSAERQIVLFTQEQEVVDWAWANLDRHAVIAL